MTEKRPAYLYAVKRNGGLFPLDELAQRAFDALPMRKPIKVNPKVARSVPQLRLYFGMLELVVENLEQDTTTEVLHEWVKKRCGVTADILLRNGETDTVAGSIAFEAMENDAFQIFFKRAIDLIVEHIIPGMDSAALEARAREMISGSSTGREAGAAAPVAA